MNLFYILFFIFCLLIPQSNSVNAFDKFSTLAVLTHNQSTWDSSKVAHPFVLYDKGVFKMWYSGYSGSNYSIGYATSLDGINWLKYPNNPIISWKEGNPKPFGFAEPFVIKLSDNDYRMWFVSTNTSEGKDLIGYATSEDGVLWKIINYKVLTPNQEWNLGGLAYPTVLHENGKFKMWFSGFSDTWKIGLATSDDGLDWTPYPDNPVLQRTSDNDYEFDQFGEFKVYLSDNSSNKYIGFYNTNVLATPWSNRICYTSSDDGITWIKDNSINPVITADRSNAFDSIEVGGAAYVKLGNTKFLWYSGRGTTPFQIGLAYEGDKPVASPSATPTPVPTPIEPIVIIPGLLASWNGPAILHNAPVSSNDWKILSFVKDYEGLMKTLKKLHYTENDTLYIWPYDWRKSISSITSDFDSFLTTTVFPKHPDRKIHIIGHSLGGLVARGWTQIGTNKDKVHQLLTVGSPNKGVVQSYPLWEAGEIPTDSFLLSLAGKILIELNRKIFDTPKETVQSLFPVLKDLLPVEPYLRRDSNNRLIQISSMNEKNIWLPTINESVSELFPSLTALYGTGYPSPNIYRITTPNWFEEKLGLWKDGKIKKTEVADGDDTIPTSRTTFSDDASTGIHATHRNLVATGDSIKSILSTLSIPYTPDDIIPGETTLTRPSLLFLLQSPVTMKVSHNSKTYESEDGIIFLSNASPGTYTVTVTGTANGLYTLSIGQFGASIDTWKNITVPIASGETQTYMFNFQANKPSPDPFINRSHNDIFTDIERQIHALTPLVTHKILITKTISDLTRLKQTYERKQVLTAKGLVELLLTDLSIIRRTNPSIKRLKETLPIDEALIDLSVRLFDEKKHPIFRPLVKMLDRTTENVLKAQEKNLKKKRLSEEQKQYFSLLYLEAQKAYQQSKKETSGIRSFYTLSHAHILLTEIH